ncbi:hypothetical protein ACKVWL_009391 [Pyricularia oryzae]
MPGSEAFSISEAFAVASQRQKYPYRAVWRQYRAWKATRRPTISAEEGDEDAKVLSDREETALVAYVTALHRAGFRPQLL